MTRLRVAAATDPGVVRAENEDAVLSSLPLVAVADGVGGHAAGEVASALAVDVLTEWKTDLAKRGARRLRDATVEANRRIYSRAQEDTALQGMATTLTAAWIESYSCTIAQVGDSRAYLLRDGELTQLTEDQSVVADLVRQGRITPEEAYDHPWRNRVLQALGNQEDVVVEMLSVDLQAGDRLLLASDGLTDEIADEDILAVLLATADSEAASRRLVELAKQAGGRDNITVLLVDVNGNGEESPSLLRRLTGRFLRRLGQPTWRGLARWGPESRVVRYGIEPGSTTHSHD